MHAASNPSSPRIILVIFQLAASFFPALKQAHGARVVSVSSRGISSVRLIFKNPISKTESAYGQSKSAKDLFAVELDKRGRSLGVLAFSVHPGTLSRNLSDDEMRAFGAVNELGVRVISEYNNELKTIEEGAATIAWYAVNKHLDGNGGFTARMSILPKLFPSTLR